MSRELTLSCQKNFINRFYLILQNNKILFYVTGTKKKSVETNNAYAVPELPSDLVHKPHRNLLINWWWCSDLISPLLIDWALQLKHGDNFGHSARISKLSEVFLQTALSLQIRKNNHFQSKVQQNKNKTMRTRERRLTLMCYLGPSLESRSRCRLLTGSH